MIRPVPAPKFPTVWAVVGDDGKPVTVNGQLPIFWYHKIAKAFCIEYGIGRVVKVRITEAV